MAKLFLEFQEDGEFQKKIFIKNNITWLDNLKVRGSWGEAGNLSSIGNYESFATIGTGTTIFGTTPGLANTAWIGGIIDTSRTWERVETTNIGLDLECWVID